MQLEKEKITQLLFVKMGLSENLKSLHSLANDYFYANSNVQLYLAIKIWKRRTDRTFVAVALFYQRNASNPLLPTSIISFGTAPFHPIPIATVNSWNWGTPPPHYTGLGIPGTLVCSALAQGGYQIQIPTAALYHRVIGGVPGGLGANIPLDLYPIQQSIDGNLN